MLQSHPLCKPQSAGYYPVTDQLELGGIIVLPATSWTVREEGRVKRHGSVLCSFPWRDEASEPRGCWQKQGLLLQTKQKKASLLAWSIKLHYVSIAGDVAGTLRPTHLGISLRLVILAKFSRQYPSELFHVSHFSRLHIGLHRSLPFGCFRRLGTPDIRDAQWDFWVRYKNLARLYPRTLPCRQQLTNHCVTSTLHVITRCPPPI